METGVIVMSGRIQVEEELAIAAVGGRMGGVPELETETPLQRAEID
jgi:hypothetical protein